MSLAAGEYGNINTCAVRTLLLTVFEVSSKSQDIAMSLELIGNSVNS